MAEDDDRPATKGDLRNFATKDDLRSLEERLRSELAAKDDLRKLGADLRAELASKEDLRAMEERFGQLVGHALRIQSEEFQSWARVFDDKYKDLPPRVARLEADVAELKATPPTPPPRRRKAGSR